ncbi:MAG: DUF2723 domain-containing protein [Candidatus Zixiibacteriota bacterium]
MSNNSPLTDTQSTPAPRPGGFDVPNAIVAGAVWLTVFLVYLSTKAVTLTFWDCGEFIAAAHTLGIPHPPGTPLWVMIGRLFAILPFFADPAARINFISTVFSSIAALFGYLSAVRLMRLWFAETVTGFARFALYAGGACGAFFLAFCFTQWGNSIEAEVYGMAMALFFAILWLTIVYFQYAGTQLGEKVMLLIVFLSFLSIGVHMTTFIIFPICALVLILKKDTPIRYWFMAAVVFFFELYLIFALSSRPDEIPYWVPVIVVFVLYLLYIFSVEKLPSTALVFVGGFLVSIAPVFGVVARLIKEPESAPAATSSWGPLSIVGLVGFIGLVGYALYQLVKSRSDRAGAPIEDRPLIISSYFVLAAAVMVILAVANLRGYAVFLLLSVLLLIGLGIIFLKYIRPAIFLAVAAAALIIIGVYPFLFGMAVVAVLLVILGMAKVINEWKTALVILLLAATGFSVHVFLPIRSSQNPMYDQTKTSESIKATIAFIERKQYGNESMVSRMFHRRADWGNQFGMYQRMGFWRFFDVQYGIGGPRFFILFVLGILGVWEAVRRKAQHGLGFALLLLICTVGLVLYMNFADGTRMNEMGQDYLEVRDRDYFWTPGFMLFGLAIGIGITALVLTMQDAVRNFSDGPRKLILGSISVLFLLPVFAVAANYRENDRSYNYIAYDYAANLLRSCPQNGVLFTYGDNDTFPLWGLQAAFGFRTDVAVVNLSLANTRWYIKQVQNKIGVNLGWSSSQIDGLRPYRTPDGRTFDYDDQVVDAVIANNYGRRPILYSTTVSEPTRKYQGRTASPNLILKGLVFEFTKDSAEPRIDVDASYGFLMDSNQFATRGLTDPAVFKDENMIRLTSAYSTAFLITADSLRKARRFADAEKLITHGLETLMPDKRLGNFLAAIYADEQKFDEIDRLIGTNAIGDREWFYLMEARGLLNAADTANAVGIYSQLLKASPHYRLALEDMARLLNQRSDYPAMKRLFQDWLAENPADKDIARMIVELDSFMISRKTSLEGSKK